METFAIRRVLIQHVEVFPFVTLPYGLGNGWTPGSGRLVEEAWVFFNLTLEDVQKDSDTALTASP